MGSELGKSPTCSDDSTYLAMPDVHVQGGQDVLHRVQQGGVGVAARYVPQRA